jgi:hypothetical protein
MNKPMTSGAFERRTGIGSTLAVNGFAVGPAGYGVIGRAPPVCMG